MKEPVLTKADERSTLLAHVQARRQGVEARLIEALCVSSLPEAMAVIEQMRNERFIVGLQDLRGELEFLRRREAKLTEAPK